jgi:hemolysin activation/secretion protein
MKWLSGPVGLLAFLGSSSLAFAQTAPGPVVVPQNIAEISGISGESLDTAVEALPTVNPEESALPNITIEFPTQQPPANSSTLNFRLSDIAIEGPEVVPRETLRPIYADLIGTEITLLKAFEVLEQIQAKHREAGYVFTRVIAPPQEIDAGIFKVQVVEAFIGKVEIEEPEGPVGAPMPLVRKIAGRIEGVENPSLQELERVLLLINDIPGITQATAVPRPGEGLGAVDLFINVVRDPFSGVFFADNRQSPILGPLILGVSLEASSWSAWGDTTTLSFFNTGGDRIPDDFKERNILQLTHQRHIGSNGTTLTVRALASMNNPGDALNDSDIDGEQFNGEITVEHPFIRTRPLSIWGSAGVAFEENEVESLGGRTQIVDDSVRVVYLGGRLLQRDDHGYTRADVQLRQGVDILGASDKGDVNLSRFDGNPEFTSLSGSIEREVILPIDERQISVFGLALGQVSSNALLSSEEFSVGGQQIGRAYDPSEFTGDSGFGVVGEIRYKAQFDVQGQPIGAQFYGYGDYAEVYNRGEAIDDEDLTSYGAGVRLSLPYQVSLSGEVAVPLQKLRRNEKDEPRFFFNLAKRF